MPGGSGSGAVHALGAVWRFQPDPAHAHDEESGFRAAHLGLSRAILRHHARTFHQRYAMLPYIYTEARRTYDTGVAFLHPLYYDWPEANEAYTSKERICIRRPDDCGTGDDAGRQGDGPGNGEALAAGGRVDRNGDRASN